MSQPQLGFVMPPSAPQYPAYPNQPYPGQPVHQPQPQPMYPGNQPFPPPIQQQPSAYGRGGDVWYNANMHSYLKGATSFHVKQKIELAEILLGWETPNQYTVYDQARNKVFYVGEESDCCNRQLCNSRRPFRLIVKDVSGQTVLIMNRKIDCSCCFGLCCPDEIEISTPAGERLGSVVRTFSIYPTFSIRDAGGNSLLTIGGPLCPIMCGPCRGSLVFKVRSLAGAKVGAISKEWSGWLRELYTDADNFNISFPHDLDPSAKAVLLAALFLIDFEYFERGSGRD